MVGSDPCNDGSSRINISFTLLPICTDELISVPKIKTIFPKLPSVNENSEQESNPILWPVYLYLSRSAFLLSFTDPNKQLLNVKSVFKFLNFGVSVSEKYRLLPF